MTNGHGGPREAGAGKKMGAPPMAARLAKAGGPKASGKCDPGTGSNLERQVKYLTCRVKRV